MTKWGDVVAKWVDFWAIVPKVKSSNPTQPLLLKEINGKSWY